MLRPDPEGRGCLCARTGLPYRNCPVHGESTESTSAALARVTAERDCALDELALRKRQAEAGREEVRSEIAAFKRMRAERDDLASLAEGLRRIIAELTEERDKARAALDATLTEARKTKTRLITAYNEAVDDLGGARLERDHARSERDALKALYADVRHPVGEPLEEGKAPHA